MSPPPLVPSCISFAFGALLSLGACVHSSAVVGPAAVEPAAVDLDALLDFADPAASEAAYRALLPQASEPGAELALWTRIARCQGLQRRFDEARASLDEVERRLLVQGLPPEAEAWVRLHLERGRVINSGGDPAASIPHFERARAASHVGGLAVLELDAVHMLGIVSPPDQALDWNLRAIEMAEGSADPRARAWLGALYNNTGWTFMDRGQPERALPLFEAGLRFRQEKGVPEPLRIARWTVARAWRALGRCGEALPVLEALRTEWTETGGEDGYVHEELGECLILLGREAEATPSFAAAWRLLSTDPWLQAHEPERLARLARLGGVSVGP